LYYYTNFSKKEKEERKRVKRKKKKKENPQKEIIHAHIQSIYLIQALELSVQV
jgi:hypothetical protein|tara:strand:- start:572 stop:730 length:159 start_codon:yes stop_codon:yes gene_type:complete